MDLMNRRLYLVGLLALVVIAASAVYVATRVDPDDLRTQRTVRTAGDLPVLAGTVPALTGGRGWLNSPPLTPADLQGKVVVYDFWTYSCVNCLRTLPHLQSLYRRYHAEGLEIVGIHSPEFDFERLHGNVTQAVSDLGVTWPVLFDDDMEVWRSFGNQYWPAEYLADGQGRVRAHHIGEGDYSQKEDEIRALLGVDPSAPRADATGYTEPRPTAAQTPELHVGTDFGGAGECSSPGDYKTRTDFSVPDPQPSDSFALSGSWTISGQRGLAGDGASLVLRYRATEVNVVMAAGGADAQVTIELDGETTKTVAVSMSQLYNVVDGGPSGYHTLTLRPSPGAALEVFAFTFGTN
jgi:thiol-disulfide isomerase/thioredoxin